MMERIFDIAHEAYCHKQSLDAQHWDQRNWDNWMTLFVKDKAIEGTLAELLVTQDSTKDNSAEEGAEGQNDAGKKEEPAGAAEQAAGEPSEAHVQLNETELEDYLQNRGEWPCSLVAENKLNLAEVLNPPAEPVAAGGKGAPKKAAPVAEAQFEEADLALGDAPENNFMLGDVVEQLIKLNFEERAKLQHPMTPNWLSLKLSIIGYPFSGLKTQAALIKEQYGLDVFHMDQLVQEAIDCPDEPPAEPAILEVTPEQEHEQEHEAAAQEFPATPQPEGDGAKPLPSASGKSVPVTPGPDVGSSAVAKSIACPTESVEEVAPEKPDSDLEGLSQDEDAHPRCREELRQCGALIRETLLEGREIPDELYVRLFVNKLRATYAYKSPLDKLMEVREEAARMVDIYARLQAIASELQREDIKERQIKKLQAEEAELTAEVKQIHALPHNGWVLVDFPCSYAQAKLLEEALSGFKPREELEPTQRETEIESAQLLTKPNPKPEPPVTLIPSGLDMVLWVDVSQKECLRRADGRRFDSEAPASHFHVQDNVPPCD